MTVSLSLVTATSNRAKLADLRNILRDLPVEILTPADALGERSAISSRESATLADSALGEARLLAEATLMIAIAEATGLEVRALGGRPGVRSPRFAREGATDAENNAELLRRLDDVDDDDRKARFRTVIAVVDPWSPEDALVVEGVCEGQIAQKPSGAGGFGYQPLFIVDGKDCTMAELEGDELALVSHRARALRALAPPLEALVKRRLDEAVSIVRGTYEPPPSQRLP